MDKHHNKVILITGAAQGIGFHLTNHFLEHHHKVVAIDAHAPALEALQQRFAHKTKFLLCRRCDVSEEPAVEALFKDIETTFGRLNVVINNAAISANCPPDTLLLSDWKRVIDVNLTGPFLLSKLAAPQLRKTKGCIVNMASTRAFMSESNTEAYSASKGGIVALTHALAMSMGPEIRVNSISPGWIDVSHLQHPIPESPTPANWAQQEHLQHPAGRIGKPEDIAACIDFLINDTSGFVTGQNFTIDGGMTRKMIYL